MNPKRLQRIPTIHVTPTDVEALEHARRRVKLCSEHPDTEHPLDSRALSELDRLIDAARRK